MRNIIMVVVIMLILMSCATVEKGKQFDVSKPDQIQIGKSTEADVLELMGSPYRSKTVNGGKVFLYGYSKASVKMLKGDVNTQRYQVSFDKNGIVKSIQQEGF